MLNDNLFSGKSLCCLKNIPNTPRHTLTAHGRRAQLTTPVSIIRRKSPITALPRSDNAE